MKRIILYIAIALFAACTTKETEQRETQDEQVSIATVISQQSRLYTSEYVVHKIVTHNDLRQLRGSFLGMKFEHELPIGDRKIAIPIDVVLQAYVDFSQIRDEDIEVQGDALHITLPDPRIVVASSKVDNRGIKTHVSWLRSDFTDAELTNFTQQGVASVLRTIPQMGIIESARQNAATLLIPLLADMGYTRERIVITFRKEFDEADLPALVDKSRTVTITP
ncbi:MAG: DUF4230 domain-containing protein [Bacteroidaceae bacterium]|nr:DUF4230 domain-containing protein [Bacteroidaceae bacterium]